MAFITSTTQPIGGALGDEWFDPSTNRIYKLVPLNGTNVTWKEYNLPSLNPVTFIPKYAQAPIGISQMLIVGGGGGGSYTAGGGGAGGLLYYGTANVTNKTPNGNSLIFGSSITITVVVGGGGGTPTSSPIGGSNGGNTIVIINTSPISNITYTAFGGGGGGVPGIPQLAAPSGGSGGGGGAGTDYNSPISYGAGVPGQGFPGGEGGFTIYGANTSGGGGGGGAGGKGVGNQGQPAIYKNHGGVGLQFDITGSNVWYAGGGGGGGQYFAPMLYPEGGGEGGRGGGGGGLASTNDGSGGGSYFGRYADSSNIFAGTINTWGPGRINSGGGGGGGNGGPGGPAGTITGYPGLNYYAGAGGSGVVIIRANTSVATYTANVTATRVQGEYVYTFTGSGNLTLLGDQAVQNLPAPTPVITSSPVVYPTSPYYLPPAAASPAPLTLSSVRFLGIGGGGGSGGNAGSAGGAGGVLTSNSLTIATATPYTITIGGGGTASNGSDPASATAGTSTTIVGGALNITALGGGAGRGAVAPFSTPVHSGGSGGGSPGESSPFGSATNYPSPSALFYTPTGAQGYPGVAGAGSGASRAAGGGGGAGGIGTAPLASGYSPDGGIGINLNIEGAPKYYAGGGGGSSHQSSGPGLGGLGGGGQGGVGPGGPSTDGWANYGGGAGAGSGYSGSGRNGGSGLVILSHPVAYANATVTGSNVVVAPNIAGNIVYKFYSPGSITFNDGSASLATPQLYSGLLGWYTTDSVNDSIWYDISGNNNNAVITGAGVGTFATGQNSSVLTKALYGSSTSHTVVWPVGVLPSTYTLFHVTRYSGGTNARIYQTTGAASENILYGHWSALSGQFYYSGWITNQSTNYHSTNWGVYTSTNTIGRSNGVARTGGGGAGTLGNGLTYGRLCINSSTNAEPSTWYTAECIIYNRNLSAIEYAAVEQYLINKYGIT